MNRLFSFLPLCLIFIAGCTHINNKKEADIIDNKYRIVDAIEVVKDCDMEWITRYEQSDILKLKERAATEEKECDVLFFGSSSIRLWKSLAEDMAPLRVVNRGYGGATLRDIHYNYEVVMDSYRPKAFVVFCGNDMSGKSRDLRVWEVFDHYRLLFKRLEKDYPGIPVYFLSFKHSASRHDLRENQCMINALMKDFADHSEQVTFIDICTPLLNADGSVNLDLFVEDKLHLNAKGYKLWTDAIKPILLKQILNE